MTTRERPERPLPFSPPRLEPPKGTMTDPVSRDHAPPYRQEAIEHHRLRPAGSGSRSPMAHHSGLVAFWALLVALAMAAAASMLIRIGEYASGPARFSSEGQTLLAVLPEAA